MAYNNNKVNMNCTNCGKKIKEDDRFCTFCGKKNYRIVSEESKHKEGYQQSNVNNEIQLTSNYSLKNGIICEKVKCQSCGEHRPLKTIHFIKNTGMLFSREQSEIKGDLCKKCINKYFLEYFLTNVFLGWWGTISFIINPFLILNNLWYFSISIFMKKEFE